MKADLRGAGVRDLALAQAATAADRSSARRANLGLVLRLLRDAGARSRTRIATETGLPKATVTNLVAELVQSGLVSEGSPERDGSIGRPGHAVELDGRTLCGIGVEINVDYLSLFAVNLRGDTVAERRLPLDVPGSGTAPVIDATARLVRETTDTVRAQGRRVVGATLAAPGVIDQATGTVHYAPNIGWRDVHLLDELRARLGPELPLDLENDAKLGAVAEYLLASAADIHDLLYVTGETGVGGGIISGGRLLRGASGFAGEIGHMPLDPGGHPCACGRRGCWETMVGLGALLRFAADEGDAVRDPSVDLDRRLAELRDRAASGDPRTLRALRQVADSLGLGLGLLADVLNPRAIVLGGHFAYFGDHLIDRVRAVVDERVMAPDVGGCQVLLSTLGFSAAARGAAYHALEPVYGNPLAVTAGG